MNIELIFIGIGITMIAGILTIINQYHAIWFFIGLIFTSIGYTSAVGE